MLQSTLNIIKKSKFLLPVNSIKSINSIINKYIHTNMSELNHPKQLTYNNNNLFAKILRNEIPCKSIYQDEKCLVFHDINPQAPVHYLVIPKIELNMLENMEETHKEILGHCLFIANKVAKDLKLDNGYRVIINNGPDGAQSVYHLYIIFIYYYLYIRHIHVLGGRQLGWPPG